MKSSSDSTPWSKEANTTPPRTATLSRVRLCSSSLKSAGMPPCTLPSCFTPRRNGTPLQRAIEPVAPLVVGADELLAVAVPLAAKPHAAVRADVLHHVQLHVLAAHQDHRALADRRALEVAGVGHFGLQPHAAPVAAVEKSFQLAAVDLFAGVGRERHAMGAGALPDGLQWEDGVGRAHVVGSSGCVRAYWRRKRPHRDARARCRAGAPAATPPPPSAAIRTGRRASLPARASPARSHR